MRACLRERCRSATNPDAAYACKRFMRCLSAERLLRSVGRFAGLLGPYALSAGIAGAGFEPATFGL
jgi:hypothetical protein